MHLSWNRGIPKATRRMQDYFSSVFLSIEIECGYWKLFHLDHESRTNSVSLLIFPGVPLMERKQRGLFDRYRRWTSVIRGGRERIPPPSPHDFLSSSSRNLLLPFLWRGCINPLCVPNSEWKCFAVLFSNPTCQCRFLSRDFFLNAVRCLPHWGYVKFTVEFRCLLQELYCLGFLYFLKILEEP